MNELKGPKTNEEINEKFIQQAKILNECLICDRNNICAVLGECFKKMDIIQELPPQHQKRIQAARSFTSVIKILMLTRGAKNKLKSYYAADKPAKKKISVSIRKTSIVKMVPAEYQERKFKFINNDDFLNWYREQEQHNFHEE